MPFTNNSNWRISSDQTHYTYSGQLTCDFGVTDRSDKSFWYLIWRCLEELNPPQNSNFIIEIYYNGDIEGITVYHNTLSDFWCSDDCNADWIKVENYLSDANYDVTSQISQQYTNQYEIADYFDSSLERYSNYLPLVI